MSISIHNLDQCNNCGKVLDLFDKQLEARIETTIGYGSLFDGSKVHLTLCCNCLDDLINRCKISPILGIEEDEDGF